MNKRKENLTGWLFIMPMLVAFLIFIAFPFFYFYWIIFYRVEFHWWMGTSEMGGYGQLCATDERLPLCTGNQKYPCIRGGDCAHVHSASVRVSQFAESSGVFEKTLRMAFFIPYISNTVALAAVFKFLFNKEGIINRALNSMFGVKAIDWITNPSANKVPIILLVIWTALGYELVIYMAALQNVPRNLYEAADMDGASGWTKFWKITFPMISPTTFYLCIVRFISVFKLFSAVNIITMGTTQASNTSIVQRIYDSAFSKYEFGYASAEATVLFVLILLITLFQFKVQKKWVNY